MFICKSKFITVGKMVGRGIGNRPKIQFITYRSTSTSGKWLVGNNRSGNKHCTYFSSNKIIINESSYTSNS